MPRPLQALCVVPFGMEEGSEVNVPGKDVGLIVGQKVQFRFFASHCRKEDRPGTMLKYWDDDELVETAPLEMELAVGEAVTGTMVPVRFLSRITELGYFELWCRSAQDQRTWKLEFNVRD